MASKVLKSFLIGIGWDTKALEAGDKKIQSSLQGVKSSALGVGAIIGALGAGAAIIASTAKKIDDLAASGQNLRTSFATRFNFGNAVKLMGGEAQEGIDLLKRAEEIQNNIKQTGTDGSMERLNLAHFDTRKIFDDALSGGTGMDLLREISRQLPGRSEGERATAQSAIGADDYSFRTLIEGTEKLDATMERADRLAGSIDQMSDSARRLADSNAALGLQFGKMNSELTEKFLPRLIGASEWMGKFLDEHREEISKTIDYAAENPAAGAFGASAAAITLGSVLSYLGLGSVGSVATKAGMPGLIASGSYMATDSVFDKLESYEGYRGFSDSVDRGARSIGLGSLVDFSDLVFNKESRRDTPSTGGRSAADSLPPQAGVSDGYKEVPSQNIDALVRAMQEAKFKVNNTQNFTFELDGQKLDARIVQVNERQNYEASEDFKPTTDR